MISFSVTNKSGGIISGTFSNTLRKISSMFDTSYLLVISLLLDISKLFFILNRSLDTFPIFYYVYSLYFVISSIKTFFYSNISCTLKVLTTQASLLPISIHTHTHFFSEIFKILLSCHPVICLFIKTYSCNLYVNKIIHKYTHIYIYIPYIGKCDLN